MEMTDIDNRFHEISKYDEGWFDGTSGDKFNEDQFETCASITKQLIDEFAIEDVAIEPDPAGMLEVLGSMNGENIQFMFDFQEHVLTCTIWSDESDAPIVQCEVTGWDFDVVADFIARMTN